MIVTVQGEREHDEEEDMCQEKEKDRYEEKEMYPDEAHIATAPLAALDQFDLGEKDTGPKQPKLHFGLQKRSSQPNWFQTFAWLKYSEKKDYAYCFACHVFGKTFFFFTCLHFSVCT